MGSNTENYNLIKPSPEDYNIFQDQNTNMDIIDSQLRKLDREKEPLIKKKSAFNKDFEADLENIAMDGIASVGSADTIARGDHVHPTDTTRADASHSHNGVYETPDGAQKKIDAHASQPDPHVGHISHSLATAPNDFLVASGVGQFGKKTVSEVKEILGLGTAAYTNVATFATAEQGTKADNALPKASYTANDVLEKLKTVDGSGSGLDADLLDGKEATAFATAEQGTKADNALPAASYTASDVLERLKTVGGSGSGLDADLLDGKEATAFATAEQGTKADNALPATSYTASDVLEKLKTVDGSGSGLNADLLDGKEATAFATAEQGTKADNALPTASYTANDVLEKLKTIDGSGSELDADLLDGKDSTAFATATQGTKADAALPAASYTASDVLTKLKTVDGSGSGLDADLLDGKEVTAFATAEQGVKADNALPASSYTASDVLTKLKTVDGSGSGIDADLLDGKDSTAFATAAQGTKADTAATQTSFNTHLADYVRQPGYGTTAGSANTYTVTLSPAPTVYIDGIGIIVKINAANTGASTLNVNGLGVKAIVDSKGNSLTAGKLRLNGVYALRYDGTNFVLLGEAIEGSGSGLDADLLDGKDSTAFATAAQGTKADAALPASSYTASDVLTKLKTVDGSGSGIDADLLDGKEATALATAEQGVKADNALPASSYTASDVLTKLKTVDGNGSGLDADLLDGKEATAFATAEQGTKADNALPTSSYTANDVLTKLKTVDGSGCGIDADLLDGKDSTAFATAAQGAKADAAATQTSFNTHLADYVRQPGYGTTAGSANTYTVTLSPAPTVYIDGMGVVVKINAANTGASTLNVNGLGAKAIVDSKGNALTAGKLRLNGVYALRFDGTNFVLLGEAIEGSGSGLDADLLDGKDSTAFATAAQGTKADAALPASSYTASDVLTKLKTVDGSGSGIDADLLDGKEATAFATAEQGTKADNALPASSYTASDMLTKLKTVDGSGSGLDADLLDGKDSTAFATATQGTKADAAATQTSFNTHLADYVRQPGYGITTGSANTYTLTLSPAPTAYIDGMGIAVKINAVNTSASTINVNGLGAKAIVDSKGNALTAGKLRLNGIYALRFDGTNFILLGEAIEGSGSGLDADLLDGKDSTAFATAAQGTKADNALPAASYTASDVLTKLKTVDGSGSGLDADLLDGKEATAFATAEQGTKADNALPTASYTASDVLTKLKTVDGSGSGIDADLLDGKDSTAFATAAQGAKADAAATQTSFNTHLAESASETVAGHIELATDAETTAGIDESKAISPKNFKKVIDNHIHKILSTESINFKIGTDLPSTYPIGEIIFFSNNPSVRFNDVYYCTVHTIKAYTGKACIQYIYPYNTDTPIYYRYGIYDIDEWKPWRALSTSDHLHTGVYATAAQGTKADNAMPNTYGAINAVSTTSSLTLAQANKVIYTSNTTAIVLTIPASTSVAFVAGTQITFIQRLGGTVTFAPASGVTLESKDTKRTIDGLYASATLIYLGSNTWSLIGALV